MDEKFWLERWEENDIGFHKEEPHHFLLRFLERLKVSAGDSFFVPLCGKSPDLVWLQGKGLEVVGVELSRLAVDAFIKENSLVGSWTTAAGMPCWMGQRYKLFCGDFFALTADDLGDPGAAYDRGSLVALPEAMRTAYAARLCRLMPTGSRVLMVSYEYDKIETYGPPFSVPPGEIESLFADDFEIELLLEEDSLWSHQGLAARGVTRLTEFAVLLTRK
jgi:thiopurine S-methyltransferase